MFKIHNYSLKKLLPKLGGLLAALLLLPAPAFAISFGIWTMSDPSGSFTSYSSSSGGLTNNVLEVVPISTGTGAATVTFTDTVTGTTSVNLTSFAQFDRLSFDHGVGATNMTVQIVVLNGSGSQVGTIVTGASNQFSGPGTASPASGDASTLGGPGQVTGLNSSQTYTIQVKFIFGGNNPQWSPAGSTPSDMKLTFGS